MIKIGLNFGNPELLRFALNYKQCL